MSGIQGPGGTAGRESGARRTRVDTGAEPKGGTRDGGSSPFLSVIMPVHRAADLLPETMGALAASDLPREEWELIAVDDASGDDTPVVAAAFADAVIRLPERPQGPAYARNRGVEVARGDCLVFIDADVRVHPDTLRRIADIFRERPDVDALFGSYDDRPPAPGIVSRFRNVMHHYVHQQNAGEAETFWAGCGAIRREAFEEAGGYDEWRFPRPQIEDIELGRRLRRLGRRILLRPEIQVTHLKRWTFRDVLRTDFAHRGVPWSRLLVQEGSGPGGKALNLRAKEKICTGLAAVAALSVVAVALWRLPGLLRVGAAALGMVAVLNLGFYRALARSGGWWFPFAAFPLHVLYYLTNTVSAVSGWAVHHVLGEPLPSPTVQGFREIGLERWPPVPAPPRTSIWSPGTLRPGTVRRPVPPRREAGVREALVLGEGGGPVEPSAG